MPPQSPCIPTGESSCGSCPRDILKPLGAGPHHPPRSGVSLLWADAHSLCRAAGRYLDASDYLCLWHEVPRLVSCCLGSCCLSTKYLTVQELAAGGNQRGDNLSHLLHFNCLRKPNWIQSRYASCPQMTTWSHRSSFSLVSIQLKEK